MTTLANTTPPALPANSSDGDDDILSKNEAARLARLSLRTWERHEAVGTAPPRVQLGTRRIGYWRRDVLGWLRSRTAPAKQAA